MVRINFVDEQNGRLRCTFFICLSFNMGQEDADRNWELRTI